VVAVCLLYQTLEEHTGQNVDVVDMKSALAIPEFHDMAQDTDHHLIVFLFFVNLLGDERHETALFCI